MASAAVKREGLLGETERWRFGEEGDRLGERLGDRLRDPERAEIQVPRESGVACTSKSCMDWRARLVAELASTVILISLGAVFGVALSHRLAFDADSATKHGFKL